MAKKVPSSDRPDTVVNRSAVPASDDGWRSLLQSVPDIVMSLDRDGKILYINRTPPGFVAKDVIGTSAFDYLPPEHHDSLRKALESVFAGGEVEQYEVAGAGPYGRTSWYFTRIGPVMRDGNVVAATVVSSDVTDRKRVEEALNESKELWRSLTENTRDFVVTVDSDGTVLATNRTVPGLSEEDVIGNTVYTYVPAEYHGSVRKALQDVFQTGNVNRMEIAGIGQSGPVSMYEVCLAPIMLDGSVTAATWIATDVTALKRAEEVSRRRKEETHALLNATSDPVALIDPSGTILALNEAVAKLLDRTGDELVGVNGFDLFPPDVAARRRAKIEEVVRSGKPMSFEDERDGIWINSKIYPVLGDTGDVERLAIYSVNITERKQAEEALRESEVRFRTAFEHSAIGMALVSPDGRLLRVNRTCCETLGYSEQELTSLSWQAVTHPDDVYATLQQVRRVLVGEADSFQLEKRFIHKRGHVLWGHLTSSLVRDADSKPVQFITQIQDITERKRAEEALRSSEERYRDLVENISEVIYEIDTGGLITYISPVVEQVGGYTASEMIGRSFTEFVHPDDLSRAIEGFNEISTGDLSPIEYRVMSKSGEVLWVRAFSQPFRDGDRMIGLRGVLTNITESKRAEEALRSSEERYRDLVENINEVIFEVDAGGLITYVSPVVEQVGGYPPSELIGRRFDEFVHPDDRERVIEGFEENLAGTLSPIEYRILSKSGEVRWLRPFSQPIHEGDRLVGFRGVLADITESKRAEEALRESEMRFRQLVDQAADAIFVADIDGKFVHANPAACDSLGYTHEEIESLSIADIVDGYTNDRVAEILNRVATGEIEGVTTEGTHRRKDGTTFPVETRLGLLDLGKQMKHVIAIARDVSERKQAEEALREREETVTALLNAPTESAILAEIDGTILALNRTAAERLGGSVDDIVGACAFDLMPADVAASRKAKGTEVIDSREPLRFEDQRDGRWFDTTVYPIADAEGNVARMAIFAIDVTDRKEMEEARDELESKVESQIQEGTAWELTFRELTVLHLIAAGKSDKEIATTLVISPRTANKHVENILKKMGASSRTEAGVRAVREGLLD